MSILLRIKKILVKAFIGGEWQVAYRQKNGADNEYMMVDAPNGTCIADPFVCKMGEDHYMFVELYHKKANKATIAYYKFIDGRPMFEGEIIEQPYHMSYPCIFEYGGKYYMIPESSANFSIDLYEAVDFPKKWVKSKCLLTGARYVDTTILKQGNAYYAISYRKEGSEWLLDCFTLDMPNQCMQAMSSIKYAENIARPAGGFLYDGILRRPAQNCAQKYGEDIIIYQVDILNSKIYAEHEIARMHVTDIVTDKKPDRIHTYNCDDLYECVDLYFEKLDLLHGLKTLWRAYLRKYFK